MNAFLIRQIQKTIDQLQCKVAVLDQNGNCLIPDMEIRYTLPGGLDTAKVIAYEGRVYLKSEKEGLILMYTGELTPYVHDLLMLLNTLILSVEETDTAAGDSQGIYRRLMMNDLAPIEADALAEEFHLRRNQKHCLFLFYIWQSVSTDARSLLEEYIPCSTDDLIVGIDRHTAALIRDAENCEEYEELVQFARAVQETVESETAVPLIIGMGDIGQDISGLHQSFRQARRAIEIGRVYREKETVFIYRNMLLERFLSELSENTANHYHNMLFNAETEKLFSEEMLQTIEMFFNKDLNLSDTARQLYIHRNTLVYRLDKIQRQIGLDLRRFDDAVTFKILKDMKKRSNYHAIEK